MPAIEAFDLATIQNCLHLLNGFEAEGMTDIRFIRARLADHVRQEALKTGVGMKKRLKALRPPVGRHNHLGASPSFATCPECGAAAVVRTVVNGEAVDTCRACRWSRYIDEYGQPS